MAVVKPTFSFKSFTQKFKYLNIFNEKSEYSKNHIWDRWAFANSLDSDQMPQNMASDQSLFTIHTAIF